VPAAPATVSEDRRLWVERQEAIAAHELARLAHAAMRDADQRTNRFRQRTRAAAKAGKPGLRQYDLRHYLDSVLVGEGMSYAKVGMVLGDSEKVVEATYAHPRRGDVAEARAAGSRGVAAEAAAASADGGRSAALEARRVAGVGDAEPA
jgi:integrase